MRPLAFVACRVTAYFISRSTFATVSTRSRAAPDIRIGKEKAKRKVRMILGRRSSQEARGQSQAPNFLPILKSECRRKSSPGRKAMHDHPISINSICLQKMVDDLSCADKIVRVETGRFRRQGSEKDQMSFLAERLPATQKDCFHTVTSGAIQTMSPQAFCAE